MENSLSSGKLGEAGVGVGEEGLRSVELCDFPVVEQEDLWEEEETRSACGDYLEREEDTYKVVVDNGSWRKLVSSLGSSRRRVSKRKDEQIR